VYVSVSHVCRQVRHTPHAPPALSSFPDVGDEGRERGCTLYRMVGYCLSRGRFIRSRNIDGASQVGAISCRHFSRIFASVARRNKLQTGSPLPHQGDEMFSRSVSPDGFLEEAFRMRHSITINPLERFSKSSIISTDLGRKIRLTKSRHVRLEG